MKITLKTPQESLNKNLLRFRPSETDFTRFKVALEELLNKIDNKETEEHQKNYVRDFLLNGIYKPKYEINTKGDIDMALFLGPSTADRAGVVFEAKRPSNKAEMISESKPSVKALHELVLYYMRERVDADNDDLKYCIATNINEWFIFRASDFERYFHGNTKFLRDYKAWRDNKKVSSNTTHFYDEIAKPFIEELDVNLECAYFDLKDYNKHPGQRRIIALYKLLSPYFLLKERFAQDSNTLDKKFYTELLHIIGLEEYKEKAKLKIRRKEIRSEGAFLEKAIAKLETDYFVFSSEAMKKYGETKDDQIYNAALELCIVWINRVLFLKLLEAQLIGYHDDSLFRFLNTQKVNNFNELARLFHDVLNCPVKYRKDAASDRYPFVPYLNSSLFDHAEVEVDTIRVHSIDDNGDLEIPNTSILRKIGEKVEKLPTCPAPVYYPSWKASVCGLTDTESDSSLGKAEPEARLSLNSVGVR